MKETVNDISLFDLFLEQQEEYQKSLKKQEKTLKDKSNTIELAIKQINQEYEDQEKYDATQVNNNSELLNKYASYIKMYSTFNGKLIGNILAYLVKVFDGIDLVYESGNHIYYVIEGGWWGAYEREIFNTLKMLVKKEDLNPKHEYTDRNGKDYIKKLESSSRAIIIEDATPISRFELNIDEEDIMFYSIENGKIFFTSSFDNYSYLKDFIDLVINYRFSNKKEAIKKEELMQLLKEFISANRDIIDQKHHDDSKKKIRSL